MADTIKDDIKTRGLQCPQCNTGCAADDRFCRNCGAYLRDDAKAIDAYLAKVVPERIDAALAVRFRAQKIVEVETAEKLAERAMGWLKTAGFLVGIPILVCGAALSFLGIKTYSDLESASRKASEFAKLVSNAEDQFGEVQKRVKDIDGALKGAQSRIDGQIVLINTQQQRLQAQVTSIQERLRFCPAKGLSSELKALLQAKLGQYIAYLEKVGFRNLDQQVSVCLYSQDDPIQGPARSVIDLRFPNASYFQEERTIYIHQDLASVASVISVALREYTHHALIQAMPNFTNVVPFQEVESALADYFPASFLDDPLIGEALGPVLGLSRSYIRNLATTAAYGTVVGGTDLHARGEIWGAALWQCRRDLSADVADKIGLEAWQAGWRNLETFSAELVSSETAAGKGTSCLSRQIAQRGLPAQGPTSQAPRSK